MKITKIGATLLFSLGAMTAEASIYTASNNVFEPMIDNRTSLPKSLVIAGGLAGESITDVDIWIDFAKCNDPGILVSSGTVCPPGEEFANEIFFYLLSPSSLPVGLVFSGSYSRFLSVGGRYMVAFDDSATSPVGPVLMNGIFQPSTPLALFNFSGSPFGTWNLFAGDSVIFDPLTYFSACLRVTTNGTGPGGGPDCPGLTSIPEPGPLPLALMGLTAIAGARVLSRRRGSTSRLADRIADVPRRASTDPTDARPRAQSFVPSKGGLSMIGLKLRRGLLGFSMAACLAVAPWTGYAGIITGCGPSGSQGPGTVCAFPDNPSPGTHTTILLPMIGSAVFYFWSGSPSNSTYNFNYEITNNTGKTMTDLHLQLFYNDLPPPLGPVNINFPNPGTSDVFLNAFKISPLELDFVGPAVLANGLITTVQFSINLPANDPGVFTNRGLRVQVTPTFEPLVVPEPSTMAIAGAGFLAFAFVRRPRSIKSTLS